jgi:hypothetical protein
MFFKNLLSLAFDVVCLPPAIGIEFTSKEVLRWLLKLGASDDLGEEIPVSSFKPGIIGDCELFVRTIFCSSSDSSSSLEASWISGI